MEVKEAIAAAKKYVTDVYADEPLTNLGLEEVEYVPDSGQWMITLGFSRPWNAPRTQAQEVLEKLGIPSAAAAPLRRSYKVITLADDGRVLSMKNRSRAEVAE